jgi:hypothetical protein
MDFRIANGQVPDGTSNDAVRVCSATSCIERMMDQATFYQHSLWAADVDQVPARVADLDIPKRQEMSGIVHVYRIRGTILAIEHQAFNDEIRVIDAQDATGCRDEY